MKPKTNIQSPQSDQIPLFRMGGPQLPPMDVSKRTDQDKARAEAVLRGLEQSTAVKAKADIGGIAVPSEVRLDTSVGNSAVQNVDTGYQGEMILHDEAEPSHEAPPSPEQKDGQLAPPSATEGRPYIAAPPSTSPVESAPPVPNPFLAQ